MEVLTVELEEPFHQKGDHGKNYKPSVFRQKGDGLRGSFENEAHDRTDEARDKRSDIFADCL